MPNEPAAGVQPPGDSVVPPSGQQPPTGQQPPAAGGAQPAAAKQEPPKVDGAQPEPGTKAGEPPKAPEKYELRVPEAAQDYVEDADLQQIETLARQAGWSNDEAQGLLDDEIAARKALSERWLAETTADQDYGGSKLLETQRLANLAIDRVRPVGHRWREPFKRLLRGGAGARLQVVSVLADFGRLMAEDRPASGSSGGAGSTDKASKLYDHTPPS